VQHETQGARKATDRSFSENIHNSGGTVAGSRPEVREIVLERLTQVGIVEGPTFGAIREKLGIALEDVSNTQFSKAVRSLYFNYGAVTYGREGTSGPHMQGRGHYVRLRQATQV
jgi:hypothetical protein